MVVTAPAPAPPVSAPIPTATDVPITTVMTSPPAFEANRPLGSRGCDMRVSARLRQAQVDLEAAFATDDEGFTGGASAVGLGRGDHAAMSGAHCGGQFPDASAVEQHLDAVGASGTCPG